MQIKNLFKKKDENKKDEIFKTEEDRQRTLKAVLSFLRNGDTNNFKNTENDTKKLYKAYAGDKLLLNNANINLFNPQMQLMNRDIYGLSNDISYTMIMQILSRESVINLGYLEFFLEMLVKNEELARMVLNKPIINAFANMKVAIIDQKTRDLLDLSNVDIYGDFDKIKSKILLAISYAELYGGCYVCLDSEGNLNVYSPSQICIDDYDKEKQEEKYYTANGIDFKYAGNIFDDLHNRKLTIFNEALLSRNFENQEFKKIGIKYVLFNDGNKYSYENIFAFSSSKPNLGQFNKKMANGFNLSRFDGNLHYLFWITDLYETLFQSAMTNNRYVLGVKDYNETISSISKEGFNRYNEALEKAVLTKTSGGFLTDAENTMTSLTNQTPYNVVLDNLITKSISIIWGIPVNEIVIENKSNAYKSEESVKTEQQGQDNLKKAMTSHYKQYILYLVRRYFELTSNIDLKDNLVLIF